MGVENADNPRRFIAAREAVRTRHGPASLSERAVPTFDGNRRPGSTVLNLEKGG